jgi:hypothetical protein
MRVRSLQCLTMGSLALGAGLPVSRVVSEEPDVCHGCQVSAWLSVRPQEPDYRQPPDRLAPERKSFVALSHVMRRSNVAGPPGRGLLPLADLPAIGQAQGKEVFYDRWLHSLRSPRRARAN